MPFVQYGVEGNPLTSELTEITVYPYPFAECNNNLAGKFDSLAPECSPIFYDTAGAIMGYCYEGDYKLVCLYWPFQHIGDLSDTVIIGEYTVFADTISQKTLVGNILKWFGVVGIEDKAPFVSANFSLSQNWPNPITSVTTINYYLPKNCEAALDVYDVSGRLIETITEGRKSAGTHSVIWDGRDAKGKELPSGIYFYTLRAGGFTVTRKMVVVR